MRSPSPIASSAFETHWPQELITLFVDELACEARKDHVADKALQACLLISKSFYFPARKHLFASVAVTVYPILNRSQRAHELYKLLKANQALANDITSFTVLLDMAKDLEKIHHVPDTTSKKFKLFTIKDTAFPQIVELLLPSRIHTLTFHGTQKMGMVNLEAADDEWHGLLVALRCIPSIRTLNLQHVMFPPRALVIGNPETDMLEHFSARNVYFMDIDGIGAKKNTRKSARNKPTFVGFKSIMDAACTTSRPPLPHLQTLTLHTEHHFQHFLKTSGRDHPFASLAFPALRSLTYSHRYALDRSDEIGGIMILSPSLTSLHIGCFHPPDPGFPLKALDFSRFQNLNHLTFNWRDERRLKIRAWDLIRLLGCVNSPVNIHTITIEFILVVEDRDRLLLRLEGREWSVIDDVLSGTYFASLRAVVVQLRYEVRTPKRARGTEVEGFQTRLAGLFPRLSAAPAISLRVTGQPNI